MRRRGKQFFLLFSLVFSISILPVSAAACEPALKIQVENRTDQVLALYIDSDRTGNPRLVGDVPPGNDIYIRNVWGAAGYHLIIAKNDKGEVVFSKEYTWIELKDMKYKVVIPAANTSGTP